MCNARAASGMADGLSVTAIRSRRRQMDRASLALARHCSHITLWSFSGRYLELQLASSAFYQRGAGEITIMCHACLCCWSVQWQYNDNKLKNNKWMVMKWLNPKEWSGSMQYLWKKSCLIAYWHKTRPQNWSDPRSTVKKRNPTYAEFLACLLALNTRRPRSIFC